ncbi:TPA: hypothetical protein ACH3X3_009533 [Trebouxia sp. C0006]
MLQHAKLYLLCPTRRDSTVPVDVMWRTPCLTLLPVATAATYIYTQRPVSQCQSQRLGNSTADPSAQLKLVQVVFRHGARSPLTKRYWDGQEWDVCGKPFEPVKLEIRSLDGGEQPVSGHDQAQRNIKLPGGCHKGELTKLGQQQARDVGEWLRQRYVQDLSFLPAQYEDGAVSGRTTNFSRTIATLQGVLTGLYPEAAQPIPVATASDMDEIMFANVLSCERLADVMKRARYELRESREKDEHAKQLQQKVKDVLGDKSDDSIAFLDLHDAMTVIKSHNKQLPEGMTEDLLMDINKEASKRMFALVAPGVELSHREELLKLSMGRMFDSVVQRMRQCADGESKHQMYMYSGHDTTIMPLLATLGQDITTWPPYVSNVIFEMWESQKDGKKQEYVKVLVNGKEVDLPDMLPGHVCTLESFQNAFWKPFIVTEEERQEACTLTFEHEQPAASGGDSLSGF